MNSNLLNFIKRDCDEVTKNNIELLKEIRNQVILITGGTGFMGTWLSEVLTFLNDNYDFNCKIYLLSEHAYNFSAKAPHLAIRKDIVLIEQDVRNVSEIPGDITSIIHAAATPDNRLHASDPIKVMSVIAKGTEAILATAMRNPKINKIINISSGLIYGSVDCSSVISAYAEAKRYAETICSAFRSQFKLNIINIRPFAFIGPYQLLDKPWAINNFIRDSLIRGTIRILGDGETIRSYMYPSDMAYGILRVLAEGISSVSYNIGSPHGITLNCLANKIASNFTQQPEIVFQNANNKNLQKSKFVPDISILQEKLGFQEKVNIDEAIKRSIAWHKETLN